MLPGPLRAGRDVWCMVGGGWWGGGKEGFPHALLTEDCLSSCSLLPTPFSCEQCECWLVSPPLSVCFRPEAAWHSFSGESSVCFTFSSSQSLLHPLNFSSVHLTFFSPLAWIYHSSFSSRPFLTSSEALFLWMFVKDAALILWWIVKGICVSGPPAGEVRKIKGRGRWVWCCGAGIKTISAWNW